MITQLYSRIILILIFSFFIGCTPDLETLSDDNQTNSDVILQIPDGFDFRTHEKVSVNINDLEGDAIYQVFSENRIHSSQIPDSLQINFDEVVNDNIIYKLKFSGITQNGSLQQNITIPTYADKVFIRRKGSEGYTSYVKNISNGSVALTHNGSASSKDLSRQNNPPTTTIPSTLSSNVFVTGNARANGGLNSNGFSITVTGKLTINGSANLAPSTTIDANIIKVNGSLNMNGGTMYASDKVNISGSLNGPGNIYYCNSASVTGAVNQNQPSSIFQQQCGTDTDGDGVADVDDDYPDDDSKAFNNYSPSETEYGLLLFEDLWPSFGDYDFNDVTFRYRTLVITNAQNEAVQVDILCDVKSSTAAFINGVGVEFTGVSPTYVQSVSGTTYTQNYITNSGNGTEAGQDDAVVIITDNVDNLLTQTTVSIQLSTPISTSLLGESPFNPFIISNQNRGREIHLSNQPSTTLGTSAFENGGLNSDPSGNFISSQGFPWGLSFLEDIPTPKEGVRINNAYNLFNSWATSGGNSDEDWYKDKTGHRNTNLLDD